MGPLYAYQTVREETQVRRLEPQDALARFAVYDDLDPKIFTTSVTLEFSVSTEAKKLVVRASGKPLPEKTLGLTDRWDVEYYRREGQSVFVTLRPGTILAFQ
jgi:hypothetical protein